MQLRKKVRQVFDYDFYFATKVTEDRHYPYADTPPLLVKLGSPYPSLLGKESKRLR